MGEATGGEATNIVRAERRWTTGRGGANGDRKWDCEGTWIASNDAGRRGLDGALAAGAMGEGSAEDRQQGKGRRSGGQQRGGGSIGNRDRSWEATRKARSVETRNYERSNKRWKYGLDLRLRTSS